MKKQFLLAFCALFMFGFHDVSAWIVFADEFYDQDYIIGGRSHARGSVMTLKFSDTGFDYDHPIVLTYENLDDDKYEPIRIDSFPYSHENGTTYNWRIPCDLAPGNYIIDIQQAFVGFPMPSEWDGDTRSDLRITVTATPLSALICSAISLNSYKTGDVNTGKPNLYNRTNFPTHPNPQPSGEVIYKFDVSPSAYKSFYVSLCNSSFDTYVHVIDEKGNLIGENDDTNGSTTDRRWTCSSGFSYQSLLRFTVPTAGTYYIVVEGFGNSQGRINIVHGLNFSGSSREEAVNDETNVLDMLLSPNPAINEFRISLPTSEPANLKLMDLTGKVVKESTVTNLELVDLADVPSGMYTASVNQGGKVFIKKLHVVK